MGKKICIKFDIKNVNDLEKLTKFMMLYHMTHVNIMKLKTLKILWV